MDATFRFGTGQVVMTPGVADLQVGSGFDRRAILRRHRRGDWGEVCAEDWAANDAALTHGGRIFSAYDCAKAPGGRVWVITEAEGDEGVRASTCLLLPDEY